MADTLSFDAALAEALLFLSELGMSLILRPEQKEAISSLVQGRDLLAVLPTGSGKSLIFQLLIRVKQILSLKAACVIVVCPLKSIVQDQLAEASLMGLTATSLAGASLQDVENGKYQLIFASAEEILAKPFLSSQKKSTSPLHQNLPAIIVDESHTVETWTGQRSTKRGKKSVAFRELFGKVGELPSFCKQDRHLAHHRRAVFRVELLDLHQLRQLREGFRQRGPRHPLEAATSLWSANLKNFHEGMTCRVVHGGQLTDSLGVKTGVRQGCLLSPFLFLLAIDRIMKTSTADRRNGIQWTLFDQLEDLDFADDLALLSHSHQEMQDKTTELAATSSQVGLKIHEGKTKILKINTASEDPVTLRGSKLEEVEAFTYLGSIINRQGGTDADVRARIAKARAAYL
ncbi:ATP-dependent helicase SGS1 [Stylophora pistillata]|uniref:ATP-dependent helicase SGS1 n=1 Tax=Stylophora pistillata TaxID=50429 RepID=A0A2B4SAT3_STYPI|nr:ATP-dependent helicase SGS1 [Stylophora pistillata]